MMIRKRITAKSWNQTRAFASERSRIARPKVKLMWLGLLCLMAHNVGAFSAYSNQELDELEKEFVQQINQSNQVIRDPIASQYINHLAQQLAAHGEIAKPYFFIVDSREINAFAGPGGYIGVNSQLILATENESELAAVMAHEMSHVRQHHLYGMIEHQKQMRIPMLASMLASIALGVINPSLATGALMGSLTGFVQDNINFVRSNEKEADRIGIDMLIKSGLDPRGMASFFKKMQQNSRYYYTDNVPAILRTHPMDDDRIAEADNRSLHLKNKNFPDHLEYHLFKELIRSIVTPNPRELRAYYRDECPKKTPVVACQYGLSLTELNLNEPQQAIDHLLPLMARYTNHIDFTMTLARAETALQHHAQAAQRMAELHANFPDHYAVILTHARILMAGNQAPAAAALLLKASRKFKHDLPICLELAQAQAASGHKDYAYFTLAQCHALQGDYREAVRILHVAHALVKKDALLKARIKAKMAELTEDMSEI